VHSQIYTGAQTCKRQYKFTIVEKLSPKLQDNINRKAKCYIFKISDGKCGFQVIVPPLAHFQHVVQLSVVIPFVVGSECQEYEKH